jgi:HAD superfamily hydrolase (TIGR01509 family)
MLRAVLFDMDGVIIDSEPAYLKIHTGMARELGFPFTEADQRYYAGSSARIIWEDLKEKHHLSQSADMLVEMHAKRVRAFYESGDLKAISATIQLIRELNHSGIACAIATSSVEHNAHKVMERLKIRPFIGAVATSNQVKNGKPAPDIFSLAAHLLRFRPEECVVIEDSKNGCLAGKAAGMKVVGYINPNSGNQDLSSADLRMSDMSALTVESLKELVNT